MEDLIEEIIGEIQDEHEAAEPEELEVLESGEILVKGSVLVREFNEFVSLDLPEEEADTMGGFVFGRVGRVGKVGDEVEVEGGMLRITQMRARRIERLSFARPTAPAPPPTRR